MAIVYSVDLSLRGRIQTVMPTISFMEAAENSRFIRPMKAAGTLAGQTASQA